MYKHTIQYCGIMMNSTVSLIQLAKQLKKHKLATVASNHPKKKEIVHDTIDLTSKKNTQYIVQRQYRLESVQRDYNRFLPVKLYYTVSLILEWTYLLNSP